MQKPEAFSQNDRFLNLFWDLATADPEVHKPAAITLIRSINECQKKYERADESTTKQQASEREACCPELSYALKRWIGGLGNTNRPGFFLALTQVFLEIEVVFCLFSGVDYVSSHFIDAIGLRYSRTFQSERRTQWH
jgi:hypothetical protein